MKFELLFTSKQNSRTFVAHCFVAHCNVFIHKLSIQEQTCLPFKRCCSKTLIKRLNWFLWNRNNAIWILLSKDTTLTWTYGHPSSCYFCSVHFIKSVYSEEFHFVQKKLFTLWSVRFMIAQFIETVPSTTVRLIQVSALYRVHFREISLYYLEPI